MITSKTFENRATFYSKLFGRGIQFQIIAEKQIFEFYSMAANAYGSPQSWEFKELSNGGYYMLPDNVTHISYFGKKTITSETAGVILTLLTFDELILRYGDKDNLLTENKSKLYEYAQTLTDIDFIDDAIRPY